MNSKPLFVWCGDSWTYGSGIVAERKYKNFSGLVGSKLNVATVNLSQPGSSIGHLSFKLKQIKRIQARFPGHQLFVFFGLTYPGRFCVEKDNGKKITIGVNSFDAFGFKHWAADVFSNKHTANESCLNIKWLTDRCQELGINFKFYNILCSKQDFEHSSFFEYLDSKHWLFDWNSNLYGSLFDLDQFDINKMQLIEGTAHGKKILKNLFFHDKHPNEQGHEKLANIFISKINQTYEISNPNLLSQS